MGEDVKGALVSVCEIRRELNCSSVMCQFWSFSGWLAKINFFKGVALEFLDKITCLYLSSVHCFRYASASGCNFTV